jgi:hypothetical protein
LSLYSAGTLCCTHFLLPQTATHLKTEKEHRRTVEQKIKNASLRIKPV